MPIIEFDGYEYDTSFSRVTGGPGNDRIFWDGINKFYPVGAGDRIHADHLRTQEFLDWLTEQQNDYNHIWNPPTPGYTPGPYDGSLQWYLINDKHINDIEDLEGNNEIYVAEDNHVDRINTGPGNDRIIDGSQDEIWDLGTWTANLGTIITPGLGDNYIDGRGGLDIVYLPVIEDPIMGYFLTDNPNEIIIVSESTSVNTLLNIEQIEGMPVDRFKETYSELSRLDFLLEDIIGATRKVNGDVVIKTEGSEATLNPTSTKLVVFFDYSAVDLESIVNTHNDDKPRFNVVDSDNNTIEAIPDVYTGLVDYLQYQLLGDDLGNVVTGSAFNDFLNLLDGDDAANGGDGQDVLDGGTGSNFLTGGTGADTFFLDGRGGTTTWSTVTDFSGDNVNIWGWVEGVSQLLLTQEDAGAAGFLGATFHYDLNNDGTIDTSITFSGLSTSEVPGSSAQVVAENGYLLFA